MAATDRSTPTTVDLFCGAGGLTLGLQAGGFRCVLASDVWQPAAETFTANNPEIPFLQADVRDLTRAVVLKAAKLSRAPDVVVGGPPCQGFSSAGARRPGDDRNNLVAEFARLVVELSPKVFVFENVEGFLTAGGGSYVFDLLEPVIDAGYHVDLRKVNVANYGVPQLRKRTIAIGSLYGPPCQLRPTHRAVGAPGVHLEGRGLRLTESLGQAIGTLPTAGSAEAPSEHDLAATGAMDKRRAAALAPGQTMRDLPVELQHPSYRRRANRRVADGMPTERRGGAPAGVRRLRVDEPSKAITSAASREFIHPLEDRALTLRECARLQTFPDHFQFVGSKAEKATLIGNAVPPEFALAIAGAVQCSLDLAGTERNQQGALMGLRLTASEGQSPALKRVVGMLNGRFRSNIPVEEALQLWV